MSEPNTDIDTQPQPQTQSQSAMDQLRTLQEQLKQAQEQLEQARAGAKKELLAKYDALRKEFKDAGIPFRGGAPVRGRPKGLPQGASRSKETRAPQMCNICEFRTDPPHNKGSHKDQDPKKAFTTEELKARGLKRK